MLYKLKKINIHYNQNYSQKYNRSKLLKIDMSLYILYIGTYTL